MDNPDKTHQDNHNQLIEPAVEKREPSALLVEDAPLDQEKFAAILQREVYDKVDINKL